MFIVSFHKLKYPNLPLRRDFLFDPHPARNIRHTFETKYIVAWHSNTTYDAFILGLLFFSYTLYFPFLTTRVCFFFRSLSKMSGDQKLPENNQEFIRVSII